MFTTTVTPEYRGRRISEARAWQLANPPQRRAWWPDGGPPVSKDLGHGASWDTPPAAGGPPVDPAELLATLTTLGELERAAELEWLSKALDYQAASLLAWQLQQPRYDPTAKPPPSLAAQRYQAAVDAALIASWRD